jgi:hypothetical protein
VLLCLNACAQSQSDLPEKGCSPEQLSPSLASIAPELVDARLSEALSIRDLPAGNYEMVNAYITLEIATSDFEYLAAFENTVPESLYLYSNQNDKGSLDIACFHIGKQNGELGQDSNSTKVSSASLLLDEGIEIPFAFISEPLDLSPWSKSGSASGSSHLGSISKINHYAVIQYLPEFHFDSSAGTIRFRIRSDQSEKFTDASKSNLNYLGDEPLEDLVQNGVFGNPFMLYEVNPPKKEDSILTNSFDPNLPLGSEYYLAEYQISLPSVNGKSSKAKAFVLYHHRPWDFSQSVSQIFKRLGV